MSSSTKFIPREVKGLAVNKDEIEQLTNFIVESDAIENIVDDPKTVRSEIMVCRSTGHVGALLSLESLADNKDFINKKVICSVQALITAEQHTKPGGKPIPERYIGQYRDVPVFIGRREGVEFWRISEMMVKWIRKVRTIADHYSERSTVENVYAVARSHFEFERIHPFIDGNGRTGRALVFYLFRFMGITPFIFTDHDKNYTYYRCFDDKIEMERYFLKRILME